MVYFTDMQGSHSHREQSALARAALLAALSREYGLCALPEIACMEGGKPYFPGRPDICFNYSHCPAGILVGVSRSPIGVDAEVVRIFSDRLSKRVFHPLELEAAKRTNNRDQSLTLFWTAKEAYLKYTGQGIRCDLREIDMSKSLVRAMQVPNASIAQANVDQASGLRKAAGQIVTTQAHAGQTPDLREPSVQMVSSWEQDGLCFRQWVRKDVCLCACADDEAALTKISD